MIYSKILIGGSEVTDTYSYNVNKSIGENNQASSFEAEINNVKGVHQNDWNVGDEVIVYADKDVNPPVTKVFTGILEDKKFTGKENSSSNSTKIFILSYFFEEKKM